MNTVPISLDLAQTVVLGAFNPSIVRPDWLIKQGICKESDFGGYDFFPGEENGEEVFLFGDLEWQVDYERLTVVNRKGDIILAAEPIALVLERLPHTPIQAVGHNFHFSCQLDQWKGPLPRLGSEEKPMVNGSVPTQTRWGAEFNGPDSRIAVSFIVAMNDDILIWLFNHERHPESGSVESAIEAVRRSQEDFHTTELLLKEMFGAEVGQ